MFSAPVWAISMEEHLCGGHYRKKQRDKLRLRHLGLWQQIILSALPIASNRVKLQINPQAKVYIYTYIVNQIFGQSAHVVGIHIIHFLLITLTG